MEEGGEGEEEGEWMREVYWEGVCLQHVGGRLQVRTARHSTYKTYLPATRLRSSHRPNKPSCRCR